MGESGLNTRRRKRCCDCNLNPNDEEEQASSLNFLRVSKLAGGSCATFVSANSGNVIFTIPTIVMDYEFSFEEADALLLRNWFYQDEDIDELLWLLTEEVFQQVYEKRHEYPFRVSLALRMHEPQKTKAVDFTDEMMDELLENEEIERITKWRSERDEFVPPPRPRGEYDDQYDQLILQIEKTQKELDKYRYYADKISSLRKELLLMKNELEEVEKRIDNENRYWVEVQWIIAQSVVANPTL